jgi:hypothetical protein
VNVVDTTPPALTLPADITVAAASPNGSVVTYSATALDTVDGSTAVTCSPASGSTFPSGTTTVSCTTQDAHHNSANGAFHVNVLSNTPPFVKVTGVADGGNYVLGSIPIPGCSTAVSVSPIAVNASLSVKGGTANGVGSFTATCSGARDVAGNIAPPVSATYTVSYVWSGFLWIDSNVFQAGSTIPLKWTLANAQGKFAGNLSSFTSLQIAAHPDCAAAPEGAPFTAGTPGDSALSYFYGQFQFNWKTTGLPAGCYGVLLRLDDGSTRSAIMQLKSNDDNSGAFGSRGSNRRSSVHDDDRREHHDDDHQWSFVEKLDDHKSHDAPVVIVPSKPNKK